MDNYIPESWTEIIIAHGAESEPLDDELREIGGIMHLESSNFDTDEDDRYPRLRGKGRWTAVTWLT